MSSLKKLQCQTCSAAIVLNSTKANNDNVICQYCGSSYQLNSSQSASKSSVNNGIKPVKPDYTMLDNKQNKLTISRCWRTSGSFALLAMAIIWNVVILNQIASQWFQGNNGSLILLLGFMIIGAMLCYQALSELLNTSELIITPQSISQKTKPIYYKDDFIYKINQIDHFLILPPPERNLSTKKRSYHLCAILKDQSQVILFKNIKHARHAIYLLEKINQLTKITAKN